MKNESFWVGTLETTNFEFTTYALSEFGAYSQLEDAWAKHVEQTGAWLGFPDLHDCIRIEEMKIGQTKRR